MNHTVHHIGDGLLRPCISSGSSTVAQTNNVLLKKLEKSSFLLHFTFQIHDDAGPDTALKNYCVA
eukprot:m.597909 g.597909  ORF g.597909 m.597909 type:complete len:65 (-) comp22418_c2_seq19:3004-3198(-)